MSMSSDVLSTISIIIFWLLLLVVFMLISLALVGGDEFIEAQRERWKGKRQQVSQIATIVAQIQAIANWETYNERDDSQSALANAEQWITQVYQRGWSIAVPNVTWDTISSVVFEWRNGTKSLAIYVDDMNSIVYLAAWGDNTMAEMRDGVIESLATFFDLYQWFISDKEEWSS